MKRTLKILLLCFLVMGLINDYFTKHLRRTMVGMNDEIATDITHAYLTSNENAIVTFLVTNTGSGPVARSIQIDLTQVGEGCRAPMNMLGQRVDAYQQVRGIRLENTVTSPPPMSTTIPILSRPDLPSVVLSTNAIAVSMFNSTWSFYVYKRQADHNRAEVFRCNFGLQRWGAWWRKPMIVVAYPFAIALNAIYAPARAFRYSAYIWTLYRGYGPDNHGP